MLMAPGMCPEANSDGERTSMNWALPDWACKSATDMDGGKKFLLIRKEGTWAKKDSNEDLL